VLSSNSKTTKNSPMNRGSATPCVTANAIAALAKSQRRCAVRRVGLRSLGMVRQRLSRGSAVGRDRDDDMRRTLSGSLVGKVRECGVVR
jgi:hypothetical protein